MKNKRLIFFLVGFLIVLSLTTFAETTKLKSIGQYTLVRIRGKVPTQDVMKMLVDRYAADIKYGFDLAGAGDLYLPFMEQLKSATFEEKALPVGDKLQWMLFRSQGKVKLAQDIEWAGKAPLEVFSFTVEKDYKAYEFVMPRPCGNISLRGVTDLELPPPTCALTVSPAKVNLKDPVTIDMSGTQEAESMEVEVFGPDGQKIATHSFTPEAARKQTSFDKPGVYAFKGRATNAQDKVPTNSCEAKLMVNAPPTCGLTTSCLPCKDYVGRPITIDASGSSDPDGQVAKADFAITDAAGNPVDQFMDGEAPFVWDKTFDQPGTYAITVVVTDDFGAVSEPCRVVLEVTQKRLFFLIEGGPGLLHGTYTAMLWARAGLLYKIVPDTLDFILSVGGGVPMQGEPWTSFVMGNSLLNVHAGPAFVAGGLGFSTKEQETRKAGIDLVGEVGVDLFKMNSSVGSILFELRAPVLTSDRSFDEHHKLLLGFRYIF
ncbi:MAG: PKD domain-containing protein [Candidatus Aminicenantales bacterium]